jgi:hypothetical protein
MNLRWLLTHENTLHICYARALGQHCLLCWLPLLAAVCMWCKSNSTHLFLQLLLGDADLIL